MMWFCDLILHGVKEGKGVQEFKQRQELVPANLLPLQLKKHSSLLFIQVKNSDLGLL